MYDFKELLLKNPVIAAVRSEVELQRVLTYDINIVFVLYGSILDIKDICDRLKVRNKIVFVHVDMIEGLKSDAKGIEYIKKLANPYGIISTKLSNIKFAHNLGLKTVQRVFIIDSQSLNTGINNIHTAMPHAIEVMPGVASKIIKIIQKDINLPIIAGGLIHDRRDIIDSISAGAVSISTSDEILWNITKDKLY
jgi:glycerol uptake operon antiterminator